MQNNIGFTEPLVDSEGFPRNDIDVRSVRIARSQINCLQNDLKNLTKTIDEGLGKYFSDKMEVVPGPSSSKMPRLEKLSLQELKPFLVVTLVDRDSPGDISGIQVHDLILKFGSITQTNFTNLSQIGELVKNSQNKQINVKVRRNGSEEHDLIIVPKVWSGQGLLGFKINAIPSN